MVYTQLPIQWVPGAFSLGAKWLGHEAYYSTPSSANIKNIWSYTSTPNMPSLCGAQFKKTQEQLYLYLYLY
jgi:hypothetical protein